MEGVPKSSLQFELARLILDPEYRSRYIGPAELKELAGALTMANRTHIAKIIALPLAELELAELVDAERTRILRERENAAPSQVQAADAAEQLHEVWQAITLAREGIRDAVVAIDEAAGAAERAMATQTKKAEDTFDGKKA